MKLSQPPHAYLLTLLFTLLVGCAVQAPSDGSAVSNDDSGLAATVETRQDCDCDALASETVSDFDRGVRALADREYGVARIHFEQHREGGTAEMVREAEVGIAFAALMAEAESVAEADEILEALDERAEVMILALAAVQALEGRIDSLDAINAALTDDLEKRDEAIKRLRELTLGQQEVGR